MAACGVALLDGRLRMYLSILGDLYLFVRWRYARNYYWPWHTVTESHHKDSSSSCYSRMTTPFFTMELA